MAESLFIRADEVIRLLGVSKSEAYRIIKRLNDEMASKGYIVVNGRVNRRYLEEQIYGEDVITDPKTPNSVRNVQMPEFLAEELKDYLDSLYGLDDDTRIFPITKSYLHHEMRRGCEASGVKKIRIHDIRHSHVSLLIDMGFSAVAIANRVGHESIDITYRYAHLFPTRQGDMADKLNTVRC